MDPQLVEFDLTLSPQPGVALEDATLGNILQQFSDYVLGTGVAPIHLHLATNAPAINKASLIGDFTEVTVGEMPGYALLSMATALTPIKDTDGNWCVVFLASIVASGVGTGCTIQSIFLTDHADALVIGAAILPTPIPVVTTGQGFVGVLKCKVIGV